MGGVNASMAHGWAFFRSGRNFTTKMLIIGIGEYVNHSARSGFAVCVMTQKRNMQITRSCARWDFNICIVIY